MKQIGMTNRFTKVFLAVVAALCLSIFSFTLGVGFNEQRGQGSGQTDGTVRNTQEIPKYLSQDVDFNQFWQVWNYVKDNYVNPNVPETELFYGALAGIVASLDDPYSVFLQPDISEKFAEELSGSFQGIGAEIGMKQNQLVIIAPLPGTPADRAGLKAGDAILTIDGQSTAGIALDHAVNIIRGPKDTEVKLMVLSAGDEEPRDVTIVRDSIEIDSVKFVKNDANGENPQEDVMLDGNIAYLALLYFNENTLADWNQTVQRVITQNPKGIILDLRNNPGGFLNTAIEVAGEWVDGKTVVKEQLRDGSKVEHKAERQARFAGIPTVVLVNGGSASGAEIVAGALQDYGVAKLVGQTTFGKGSVQDLKQFSDGSSVKLTIAEWLTPNDRNINKEGIKPDVEVERTREDYDANRDPQLDKALEILKQ